MHEVKIDVVGPKIFQSLVERWLNILRSMLAVPELSCKEDVLALDARLLDTSANFSLIAIDSCAVNVSVTLLQRFLNGFFDFIGSRLPCPEADGRNLRASVQLEVRGETHGDR